MSRNDLMHWQQSPAADFPFGIARFGGGPLNQFDSWKDPAGILPTPTRASQPLAENCPCDHHPRLVVFQRSGEVSRLSRGPHQQADQRSQQIRRNSQPRTLGNVVDLAHQLESVSGAGQPRENLFEFDVGPLERRGDQSGCDNPRLHQSQIIVAEVEQLCER